MVRRRSIFCRTSAAPSIDTVLYFRSSDSCRHRFAITAARAAPPAAARTDTKVGEPIRHSETFDVPAVELLATVRQHGLEGIVAKRRSSTYRPGDRSGDWVKMRANRGQEFVIERGKGRWGEGLTAEDMKLCRWLKPQLVASIEFLEWTLDNHLRHPKFVSLRKDRIAREVVRDPA